MKTMLNTILVAGALVLLASAAPTSRNEDAGQDGEAARQVDIMRRVLAKGLQRLEGDPALGFANQSRTWPDRRGINWRYGGRDENAPGEVKDPERTEKSDQDSNAAYRLWYGARFSHARSSYNARGFLLPGHGAFFSLDVSVGTVEVKEKNEEKPRQKPKDDLWEEAKSEAEGRTTSRTINYSAAFLDAAGVLGSQRASRKPRQLDQRAMDKVVDTLARLLVRHAGRMTKLEAGHQVIIAVSFKADRSRDPDYRAGGSTQTANSLLGYIYSGGSSKTRHVVIRASLGRLRDLKERESSMSEIRSELSITDY